MPGSRAIRKLGDAMASFGYHFGHLPSGRPTASPPGSPVNDERGGACYAGPVQRRAKPDAQFQGKCIFCSKAGLTKEHLWPVWATPLLGNSRTEKHTEQLFTT